MLTKATCKHCHKPFSRFATGSKNVVYCSIDCRSAAGQTSKPCMNCGQPIKGRRSYVERRKYCSNTCQSEYQKVIGTVPERNKTVRSWDCPVCGKQFKQQGNRGRRYCSQACYFQGRRSIHNGGTYIPKLKENGRQQNEHARRVIANKILPPSCAICGWDVLPCDCHHIVPVRKGGHNGVSNLIRLCPNHHRMADRGLYSTEELLEHWQSAYSLISIPERLK